MTDISNEAVERLADYLSFEQDQEAADMLRALRSALDIAETEKRAAVAAALVTFVDLNLEMFGDKHAILDPSALAAIRQGDTE